MTKLQVADTVDDSDRSPTRRDFLKATLSASALVLLGACAPAAAPPTAAPAKPAAPAAAPTQPAAAATAPPSASPAAGASPAASPAAAAPKPTLTSIRVLNNVPLDPTIVPDFIAFKRLKDQYGVDVDVQDITGADEAIKALVAGQAQFSISSFASGVLAVGQGQQIRAVVPSASAPYFTLIVTSDVQDWKDLAGKRIGVTATSDASYWNTVMQLKKYGVDPSAIQWITVRGSAARAQALQAGKIDGAQVLVGQGLELIKDSKFKRFADVAKDFPNLLFNGYWSQDSLIRDHPTVIQAFAEALMQAHRDVQDKTKYMAQATQLLAGKVDEATISASYDILAKDMNIWDPNEARWNDQAGEFTSHALADYGAVEKYVPFSQWASTRFVDAARERLGPYKS